MSTNTSSIVAPEIYFPKFILHSCAAILKIVDLINSSQKYNGNFSQITTETRG